MKIDQPYIKLVKESLDKILSYINGIDRQKFLESSIIKDACLTRLIVVGEYSAKISEELKNKYPNVEWQQIKAARNFYVHMYGRVNWEMIWETIQKDLPQLKLNIEVIIADLEEEN